MRSSKEMMSLILKIGKANENIRACFLCGSRANLKIKEDEFQDYDIIYAVRNTATFHSNEEWISVFGKRVILQEPEKMNGAIGDGRITYLMLLEDGNRIDLQIIEESKIHLFLEVEPNVETILDKDSKYERKMENKLYRVKKLSVFDYADCCNEIWWCSQNVAKAIIRNEMPHAMFMLQEVMRKPLHAMLDCYIGMLHGFDVNVGKFRRYYIRYLKQEEYEAYILTYCEAEASSIWNALFQMLKLFDEIAIKVADTYQYMYPKQDAHAMLKYLKRAKKLY